MTVRHEALHMAYFLGNAIGRELCDNEAVATNPDWLALAQKAETSLAELHQAIGKSMVGAS